MFLILLSANARLQSAMSYLYQIRRSLPVVHVQLTKIKQCLGGVALGHLIRNAGETFLICLIVKALRTKAWSIKYMNNRCNNYLNNYMSWGQFYHSKSKLLQSCNSFNLNVIKHLAPLLNCSLHDVKTSLKERNWRLIKQGFRALKRGWLFYKV